MAKITITRALVELKTLDDRVKKAIESFDPVNVLKGGRMPPGYGTKEDFAKKAKSTLAKIRDLRERKRNIKAAIAVSNAETRVKIGGKTMTVAEAIQRKNDLATEHAFLKKAKGELAVARDEAQQMNTIVEKNVLALLEQTFGKDRVVDEKQARSAFAPYEEHNTAEVFDPLKIETIIESEEDDLESFVRDVDVALSEINGKTKIDV